MLGPIETITLIDRTNAQKFYIEFLMHAGLDVIVGLTIFILHWCSIVGRNRHVVEHAVQKGEFVIDLGLYCRKLRCLGSTGYTEGNHLYL